MPGKLEKAKKLREQAKQLEVEAEYERIYSECTFHGYKWHNDGKCYSQWGDWDKCANHFDAYTDDYGSWVHCHRCHSSNGRIFAMREIREPEWDAPKPPKEHPNASKS